MLDIGMTLSLTLTIFSLVILVAFVPGPIGGTLFIMSLVNFFATIAAWSSADR